MREVGGRVSEKEGRGVTSFVVGSRVDPEIVYCTGKSDNQSINITSISKPLNKHHRLFSDVCFCWTENIKGSMDGGDLGPWNNASKNYRYISIDTGGGRIC